MPKSLFIVGVLLSGASAPKAPAAPPGGEVGDWELLSQEDGIEVWRADVEGSPLMTFLGRGLVHESLEDVFTVIGDLDGRCRWQSQCAHSRTIRRISRDELIGYYRIKGRALASPRDTVFRARLDFFPSKGTIEINFREVLFPGEGPQDGVVRMPTLRGFWRLKKLRPRVIEVTYQVQADPGGWLPNWLFNLASKALPYFAILNLRDFVAQGDFGSSAEKAAYHRPQGFADFRAMEPGLSASKLPPPHLKPAK